MQLIIAFIFTASLVLSDDIELPDNFTTTVAYETTPSPTMPTTQDPLSSMSLTTPLPLPLYIPTATDNRTIIDCFYRRIWERIDESTLAPAQLFCKRLAANSPNEEEAFPRDPLNKFASFRTVWDQLVDKKVDMAVYTVAINFWRHRPNMTVYHVNATKEEVAEIEDCYFYRAWKSLPESKLTPHESFCLRLDSFKPDVIETQGIFEFLTFAHIYETMADAALTDLADTTLCIQFKERTTTSPDKICKVYNKRIENPASWRDIRIKEVHECILANYQAPNGPRRNQCLDVIRDFQRIYLRSA